MPRKIHDKYPKKYIEGIGRSLYMRWLRILKFPHSKEFDDYLDFYKWAMDTGYEDGSTLVRHNKKQQFSPDNCYWNLNKVDVNLRIDEQESIKKFNDTVNAIRRRYGMEPLPTAYEEV